MFEQSLVPSGKGRRPWTVALALIGQVFVLTVLILIPLLYVQSLPMREFTSTLVAPPPPPPPPPPPQARVVKVVPRKFDASKLTAPKVVPKEIAKVVEAPPPPPDAGAVGGIPGGVPGGQPGGVIAGIANSVPKAAPPPPPPPPEKTGPQRVHVGGNVQAARLVKEVKPAYPPMAKQARISGTVRLKAIIGPDGAIRNLNVISGHPMLVQSAISAVKQWVYKPTVLNGQPVEVDTEIDVNFTLAS
jgi:protein TonB